MGSELGANLVPRLMSWGRAMEHDEIRFYSDPLHIPTVARHACPRKWTYATNHVHRIRKVGRLDRIRHILRCTSLNTYYAEYERRMEVAMRDGYERSVAHVRQLFSGDIVQPVANVPEARRNASQPKLKSRQDYISWP